MAYWQISYFDESGYVRKLPSLKADSREQAIQLSGLCFFALQPLYCNHAGADGCLLGGLGLFCQLWPEVCQVHCFGF